MVIILLISAAILSGMLLWWFIGCWQAHYWRDFDIAVGILVIVVILLLAASNIYDADCTIADQGRFIRSLSQAVAR